MGTKDNPGNPYYRCSNILFTLCNGIDRRTLDYDEMDLKGNVNVLLLDKTGTITLGNRQMAEFLPVGGQSYGDLMEAALLSSFALDTP